MKLNVVEMHISVCTMAFASVTPWTQPRFQPALICGDLHVSDEQHRINRQPEEPSGVRLT